MKIIYNACLSAYEALNEITNIYLWTMFARTCLHEHSNHQAFGYHQLNTLTIVYHLLQRPHKANLEEMTKYHSDDYVKFLKTIRPDNMSEYTKQMQRCEY